MFERLIDTRNGSGAMVTDNEIVMQARQLRGTIRALQQRLMIRSLRFNTAGRTPARELTLAQMTTLMVIHERNSVNLKELAEATHVSPPSASAMVDRLVDLGLAARHVCDTDRREVRITLTTGGAGAVEHCQSELLQTLTHLLQRLGPETARQWCEVYDRIQEILDREAPAALAATAE